MTPGRPFEQLVENWLTEVAPATVPANLHATVVGRARHTRQRRTEMGVRWRRSIGPARIAIDLAAVIVLAVGAFNLLVPRDAGTGSGASPSATSAATDTPEPTPSSAPVDSHGEYLRGRHALTVDGVTVSFSIDSPGWAPHDGFLISKWVQSVRAWHDGVIFWSAFPSGEKATACLGPSGADGSSARDVADALAAAPGTELLTSPVDATIGGRPAVYVSFVVREAGGCDPGFVYRWQPQTGIAPWTETLPGDKIQVWVVELDGRLLFIGALTRGDYMEPEIASIVASMTIESAAAPSVAPFRELPLDTYGDYRLGRQYLAVDTFDFSVSIPAYRWRPYPNYHDGFLIARRDDLTYGPSGLIFWAAFPEGGRAASCLDDGGGGDPTALGVAGAIAAAPGTTLEAAPIELTVGGRPAAYVSVVVGDDLGCDPAFVYGWQPQAAGVPWYRTAPGDTVRAWIVEVDDRLLFIGALIRGPTYGSAYLPGLESEIESIVDSLRFE